MAQRRRGLGVSCMLWRIYIHTFVGLAANIPLRPGEEEEAAAEPLSISVSLHGSICVAILTIVLHIAESPYRALDPEAHGLSLGVTQALRPTARSRIRQGRRVR